MTDLHLILVDPSEQLCDAFHTAFVTLPNAEIVNGYFQRVAVFDCMVSPANSFGLMDGGVDAAIIDYFGADLMQRVQRYILDEYLGEQPVGTSFVIETHHPDHPWLAHTPTMRIPMQIIGTDYVYLAMWAMLRAVHYHNRDHDQKIKTVVCPGLGTGVGHMPFSEAARQMALAYKNYLNPPTHIDWTYASRRQILIQHGGHLGL